MPSRATSSSRSSGRTVATGKPKPPTDPAGAVKGASWTNGGPILAMTGKVVFTMGGGDWICSGSVVNDGGRAGYSMVLTAGHCAID